MKSVSRWIPHSSCSLPWLRGSAKGSIQREGAANAPVPSRGLKAIAYPHTDSRCVCSLNDWCRYFPEQPIPVSLVHEKEAAGKGRHFANLYDDRPWLRVHFGNFLQRVPHLFCRNHEGI